MVPLTGENAIRLFCLNVLLFCALIYSLDYAERRGVITFFGFKGEKLSDSNLRKMVFNFKNDKKPEKKKKKDVEEILLNPLLRGGIPYEIEEEICGEDVFAFTNRSFLETIATARLKKGDCKFCQI